MKMFTITIAVLKMTVLNNRMFILNGITKKMDVDAGAGAFMDILEALEGEWKDLGVLDLAMLILFAVINALVLNTSAAVLALFMILAAAVTAGAAGAFAVTDASTSAIINKRDFLHGRSCTGLEFP